MMKNLLLSTVFTVLMVVNASAQDPMGAGINGSPTQEGNWLVEINTGFGGGTSAHTSDTGVGFYSQDGNSTLRIGGEGGYFIQDNLAIKAGLAFNRTETETSITTVSPVFPFNVVTTTESESDSFLTYKIGAKYYVQGKYPVQADITGSTYEIGNESPLWFGLQGGYTYFVHHNVAIEPGIRYNISMNDDFAKEDVFELRVGASIFF